jgi:mitogen-activated protein kinase organizer 1
MPKLPTTPLAALYNPASAPIHAVTYSSPDPSTLSSQYILTGSADRAIRLWNPSNGAPLSTTSVFYPKGSKPPGLIQTYSAGHAHPVTCISVSRTNDKFVSGGGDKHVLLWDVIAGHVIRRWEGHTGQINAVTFAGDSKEDNLVISGSFDSTIRVWDMRQQGSKSAMVMAMSEARDAVTSIAMTRLGTVFYAGSVDGRVRGYDFRMGRVTVDVLSWPVTSLCCTRGGDAILVGTLDSTLRLLDTGTGKLLQTFSGNDERMLSNEKYRLKSTLAMNDTVALCGTEDGRVLGWDVLSGKVTWELEHTQGKAVVGAVVECPTREEWCSVSGNGTAVVWGQKN